MHGFSPRLRQDSKGVTSSLLREGCCLRIRWWTWNGPRVVVGPLKLDSEDDRYRIPLQRDAAALKSLLSDTSQVVLLGSVATEKYVKPLLEVFGAQLVFPSAFVGRGEMSRGGTPLALRARKAGTHLYPGAWKLAPR